MPQRKEVPAFEDEAAEHAAEHDDGADDLDHLKPTDGLNAGTLRPASVSAPRG